MINKIFRNLRKYICPNRIYKYGKVGLAVYDDRSLREKVFDNIEAYLARYEEQKRINKENGFHPYFDWSLGLWINSRSAIRDIERSTGYEYVTVRDWEKESVRQRRYMDEKFEKKLEDKVGEVIKDINQGRSFVKENREKRRSIYQKYGKHS